MLLSAHIMMSYFSYSTRSDILRHGLHPWRQVHRTWKSGRRSLKNNRQNRNRLYQNLIPMCRNLVHKLETIMQNTNRLCHNLIHVFQVLRLGTQQTTYRWRKVSFLCYINYKTCQSLMSHRNIINSPISCLIYLPSGDHLFNSNQHCIFIGFLDFLIFSKLNS